MEQLTASLEDYLEVICNFIDDKKTIRAIDISRELHISRASVTEALKKLSSKGLVNYGYYDSLTLTKDGENVARSIINKHKILQKFFENILCLNSEEASYNACKIEHIITQNAFEGISKFVQENESRKLKKEI